MGVQAKPFPAHSLSLDAMVQFIKKLRGVKKSLTTFFYFICSPTNEKLKFVSPINLYSQEVAPYYPVSRNKPASHMNYDRACLDTVHHRGRKDRATMHLIRRAAAVAPPSRPWTTSGARNPAGIASPSHILHLFLTAKPLSLTKRERVRWCQIQIICGTRRDRKLKWAVKSALNRILKFLLGLPESSRVSG